MKLASMGRLLLLLLGALVSGARPSAAACDAGEARLRTLIDGLRSETPATRKAAAMELGGMEQRAAPALPALLDGIRDPDGPACSEIRRAIAAIVPADARLFRLLEEEKHPGEAGVLGTLGRILRGEGAYDWNRAPTDEERSRVARGEASDYEIGRVMRKRSFPVDRSDDTRAAMVLARALGPRAASLVPDIVAIVSDDEVRAHRTAVMRDGMRALSRMGPEGIVALRKLLADPDSNVREVATAAIAQSPRAASALAPGLVPMLENEWAGEDAARALGLARPVTRESLDALVEALRSPVQDIRLAAAESIGRMGEAGRPAVPALAVFLVDPELADSLDPREALLHLGPVAVDALPELIQSLAVRDVFDEVAGTADVLRAIGEPSVPALMQALANSDPGVRARAAEALRAMPELAHAALPALARAEQDPDPGVRRSAEDARIIVGEAAGADLAALDGRTRGTQGTDRSAALQTISRLPKERLADALPLLKRCFEEGDRGSASDCASALGRMGASASPAIGLMAERMQRPGEAGIEMFDAIVRLGPAAELAVPVLCGLLDNRRDAEREGAARALGAIGPAALGAVPRLEELLDDDDWSVQVAASEALWRIRGSAPGEQ